MMSRLASLHSYVTKSPDYDNENKWTFLTEVWCGDDYAMMIVMVDDGDGDGDGDDNNDYVIVMMRVAIMLMVDYNDD